MAAESCWSIREPWGAEWRLYRRILSGYELPTEGVGPEGGAYFLVAVDRDGKVAGGVGVEGLGPDVLLRSLAVSGDCGGAGLGTVLLTAAEQAARVSGAKRIYLLTTSAVSFFGNRGYSKLRREGAPESVRASQEFASLCPATAQLMVKGIDPGPHDREEAGRLH